MLIKLFLTYHCTVTVQNIHVQLDTAGFQDTGILGCFTGCQPGKQQDCGNLKFCSCCFSNVVQLESVLVFEL